jgi:proline iminopeptidase
MRPAVVACAVALAACSSSAPRPAAPAPATAPEEGFVDAGGGVQLHYRKLGSGASTVIVPGDFLFRGAFDGLARDHTVILYDMRNRGRSSAVTDDAAISIQHDLADLETVRAHFGVERASLVGWSYMGLLVVLYAAEHPDRVARIVQIGPVARRVDHEYAPPLATAPDDHGVDVAAWNVLEEAHQRGEDKTDPRGFCEREWPVRRTRLVGDPANADRLGGDLCDLDNELPPSLGRHFPIHFATVMALEITDEQVARVSMPVLTIHGTRDRNAPYGGGLDWARELPDARLITLDGAGHAAWADDPAILDAIASFLRGQWPARAQPAPR